MIMSPVAEKLVWFGKDFFTFWEKYLEEIEGVRLEEVKDSLLWTPANVEVGLPAFSLEKMYSLLLTGAPVDQVSTNGQ